MLKFQEAVKHGTSFTPIFIHSKALIAGRYNIYQKLGHGSFGTVYLVSDKKAKEEEQLKVLKEICVGNLKPNETVEANLEAQLLSRLDHPAIVKFYTSFVEGGSFCIITEYCEGQDLDFKIQEYKRSGKVFPESQIVKWFIQLLLGVNYLHKRQILHRDLKAKNIFLKNNLVKIGDFGISRLLIGSCDLATTFIGTPFYMSPEALQHQGYDTKSDIWSLGCILYEMCCLNHMFTGHSFLTVVLKIVESKTPSLPDNFPRELDAVLHRMLNKNPSLRPSAAEILKTSYIDHHLQIMKYKHTNMSTQIKKDWMFNSQEGADHIISAVKKKVHLQTLRAISEVQKMTPRERMRLRKLNLADQTAQKLKQLAEEKYQENLKRMKELRFRNFHQVNIDVLHESDQHHSEYLIKSQSVTALEYFSIECSNQRDNDTIGRLNESNPAEHEWEDDQPFVDLTIPAEPQGSQQNMTPQPSTSHTTRMILGEIPEDPLTAEEYYNDPFDSCSETSEESDREQEEKNASQTDSDINAMVRYMENIVDINSEGTRSFTEVTPVRLRALNNTMATTKLRHMKETAIQKLGADIFEKVYEFLQQARERKASEDEVKEYLGKLVSRASDCFEVDQLLYFEDQLQSQKIF